MDRQAMEEAVRRLMFALRVMVGALAASVVLYAALAFFVTSKLLREALVPVPAPVVSAITVASLLLIFVGYLAERAIRGRDSGEPGASRVESSVVALTRRYARAFTVATVLREATAVIGFVLSLLTADPTWSLLLSGAALLSMLIHWPRRAAVEDWLLQQGHAG